MPCLSCFLLSGKWPFFGVLSGYLQCKLRVNLEVSLLVWFNRELIGVNIGIWGLHSHGYQLSVVFGALRRVSHSCPWYDQGGWHNQAQIQAVGDVVSAQYCRYVVFPSVSFKFLQAEISELSVTSKEHFPLSSYWHRCKRWGVRVMKNTLPPHSFHLALQPLPFLIPLRPAPVGLFSGWFRKFQDWALWVSLSRSYSSSSMQLGLLAHQQSFASEWSTRGSRGAKGAACFPLEMVLSSGSLQVEDLYQFMWLLLFHIEVEKTNYQI